MPEPAEPRAAAGLPQGQHLAALAARLRQPRLLLESVLLLMLATGFLMPTGSAWCDVFYVIVGPGILVALARGNFEENWRSPAILLPVALILWSSITVFWCNDQSPRTYLYLLQGGCCLLFLAGLVVALREAAFVQAVGNVLIWFGTLNAAVSEALYPLRNGIGGRLAGFSETRQAILGASLIAVAALFALSRALDTETRGVWRRVAYVLAAVVMILFILLTQSRGPLAGIAGGVLVLVLASPWRWRWALLTGLIGVPALLLAASGALRRLVLGVITARGTSFRPEIWRASVARVWEHPLIGHGMNARLDFKDFTFPHDLYLSLLFYSGVVGLGLFVALASRLVAGIAARRGAEQCLLLALWANMLISGLTDYGQIIKGPSPLWYIIWLPVAYSAVYVTRACVAPSKQGAVHRLGRGVTA